MCLPIHTFSIAFIMSTMAVIVLSSDQDLIQDAYTVFNCQSLLVFFNLEKSHIYIFSFMALDFEVASCLYGMSRLVCLIVA